MFTGIIEACLPVAALTRSGGGLRLSVDAPVQWDDVKLGDSIAVNGVCLTVESIAGHRLSFFAVPETLELTTLNVLQQGKVVNLERAMAAGARFDGHLVQGHVDRVGHLSKIEPRGDEYRLTICCGEDFAQECVHKGSVCIDGISLTIASLGKDTLIVAIIPHTWEVTCLSRLKIGDSVNLEADVIGKYVRRQLNQIFLGADTTDESGVNVDLLRRAGFTNE